LPKVPILDADAISMLKGTKNRVMITLRYDARQKMKIQEEYLRKMKTYYQPQRAYIGPKSKAEESKDEYIKSLSKLNNTL